MRAFWVRLRQFIRISGVIVALVAIPAGIYFALSGPRGWRFLSGPLIGVPVGLILILATMSLVAAGKYKRSASTVNYEQALFPLLQSRAEYCLVLRPFGRDGHIVVPDLHANEFATSTWLFRRNVVMEQIVAEAARSALSVVTYGIVDQKTLMAPPGLAFLRVPNSEWQTVALHLIRRAHSIVLLLPPNQNMGDGFAWEIRQIAALNRRSRVIIVLPPSDQDHYAHELALGHAGAMLAMLENPGRGEDSDRFAALEYQFGLDETTIAVKCRQVGGVSTWALQTPDFARRRTARLFKKQKTLIANTTYLACLTEALKETEFELSRMNFESRYP